MPRVYSYTSFFTRGKRSKGDEDTELNLSYKVRKREEWIAPSIEVGNVSSVVHREDISHPRMDFFFTVRDGLTPAMSDGLILDTLSELDIPNAAALHVIPSISSFLQKLMSDAVQERIKRVAVQFQFVLLTRHRLNDEEMISWATRESENLNAESGFRAVPATTAAIDELKTIIFMQEDGNSNDTCMVCLEEFVQEGEVKQMPCFHIFHGDCIGHWLKQSNSCPICRFALDDPTVHDS